MKTSKKFSVIVATVSAAFALTCEALTHVDLLVAYDTTGANWLSEAGLNQEDFAKEQVARANEVLANSGLGEVFDFRLVGVYAGGFTHDNSGSMYSTLEAATEGTGSEWVALRNARDEYGADIVVVLVEGSKIYLEKGLSNAMEPYVGETLETLVRQYGLDFAGVDEWLAYFAERAFSIVDIASASDNYTFIHEVGHVMGAGHSEIINPEYDDPGPQLFSYSSALMARGSDGNNYATIMGYNVTGYTGSERYTVLPYFSSPDLTNPETGEALGDVRHNNVLTLLNTYDKVAAFRAEVVPPPSDDPGDTPSDDPGDTPSDDPGDTPSDDPGDPTDTPSDPSGTPDTPEEPSVTPDQPVTPVTPVLREGAFTEKKLFVDVAVKDGESLVGFAEFTVAATKKGVSKVSVSIIGLDGKKMKSKNNKYDVYLDEDGVSRVTLKDVAVKGFDGLLNVTLGNDSSVVDGTLGEYSLSPATKGIDAASAGFYIAEPIETIMGGEVVQSVEYAGEVYNMLPYASSPEQVTTGLKWSVAKGGKIKLKKDRATGEQYILPTGTENFSALKLNYQAKTGGFKGSFTVYALIDGKLKKFKFNVTGVVADNEGVGIAVCKKTGTVVNVAIK